jgi:hypothetical protein
MLARERLSATVGMILAVALLAAADLPAGGVTPGNPLTTELGKNTPDYFLQPRVRAQILLTVNEKTITKLDAAAAEFSRLFPDGFTQTTFPRTAAERTTLAGAWFDKSKQKTTYDKNEMLYVDFDPAACKDCVAQVAKYKDYIARLFGESEVWVTLTPIWRVLTPSSPDWAEAGKPPAK